MKFPFFLLIRIFLSFPAASFGAPFGVERNMKITTTRGEVRPPRRFYICDRTKCRYKDGWKDEWCGECRHTSDIEHALYDEHPADGFECINGTFWERER